MDITPEQARAELARRRQAQQSQPSEKEESTFDTALRVGVRDPAIGFLNLGRQLANLPHNIFSSAEKAGESIGKRIFPDFEQIKQKSPKIPSLTSFIPQPADPEFDYAQALGQKGEASLLDKLIQGAVTQAPALFLPGAPLGKAGKLIESIPKVGKISARAVSEAIPQSLYAATQAENDPLTSAAEAGAITAPFAATSELLKSQSPLVRGGARAASGLLAGLLGKQLAKDVGLSDTSSDLAGIASGALGARGFASKRDLVRKLTEGVDKDLARTRMESAERLGLDYLTPAEAGVSPYAASIQGALGKTGEGQKMLYERGQQRIESERKAINDLMNKIYDEAGMAPEIEKAYKNVMPSVVPENIINKYDDNAIVKRAIRVMENRPAFQEELKNVPTDSLGYWDLVKQSIYDLEEKAPRNEANIIKKTRRALIDDLDTVHPEYEKARNLYERKMVREGLEKTFDKKEITGRNFYQALASQNKFDQLMHHLRNVPAAQESLKDMRKIFKDLMAPPTIRTAKGTTERGMDQARNPGKYLEELFTNIFTKGKNDKAAIDLITSKQWLKNLEEINNISNKQMKLVALTLMIGKGIAQQGAQSS